MTRQTESPAPAERGDGGLDAELAEQVANLSVEASKVVDALLGGAHRSPRRGASVVFAEHREYRPGDDLRLLDWRAYARTDRYQTKHFEQESHLRATLVIDHSGSMAYGGEGRLSKAQYGAKLLAALALILLRQGDAPGLATIDHQLRNHLPPRSRPGQLQEIMRLLLPSESGSAATDLKRGLTQVAEGISKRGILFLVSDLLDESDGLLSPLAQLTSGGHDVVVFQILDPDEIDFPFLDATRFVGMEGEQSVDADPTIIGDAYRDAMQSLLQTRRQQCLDAGIRYTLVRTDDAIEGVLSELLNRSGRRKRS